MSKFVMLTRLTHGALKSPHSLESLEKQVMERIRAICPQTEWLASYAVLGPYDYIDVFEAPDNETATKISALVRTFGHAHTEIWPATDWTRYKDMIRDLPGAEE